MRAKQKKIKSIIGWREWCVLPELGIPAIKAKSDTGATTSSLHAIHITPFKKGRKDFVRFETHPIQNDWHTTVACESEIIDQLHVASSSGHREERFVIQTPLLMNSERWDIKLTLTTRETMGFRMLLGREAMKGRLIVDPEVSYQHGKKTDLEVHRLYKVKKMIPKLKP